jgi:ATP-dependent DNA ligase
MVDLRAKSGKPLGRYFPEVVAMLSALAAERFVLDGELVIEIEGRLAFDALQMRLHPAESRIRKLSAETPARHGGLTEAPWPVFADSTWKNLAWGPGAV